MCYKYNISSHITLKYYSNIPLSQAKSTHLQTLYQCLVSNHELDFLIPNQAQDSQEFFKKLAKFK